MLTTRELPPEEWSKLAGTELGEVWRSLPPAWTTVLVVEDEIGAVVGTWALITVVHAEGLWVHPDHRTKTAVGRRLLIGMREVAGRLGLKKIVTIAVDDKVRRLLARAHATRIPGEQYVLPLFQTEE